MVPPARAERAAGRSEVKAAAASSSRGVEKRGGVRSRAGHGDVFPLQQSFEVEPVARGGLSRRVRQFREGEIGKARALSVRALCSERACLL